MPIDDGPVGQLAKQDRTETRFPDSVSTFAAFLAAFSGEPVASITALIGLASTRFSNRLLRRNADDFRAGVMDGLGNHEARLQSLESAASDQAVEAVVVALEKARDSVRPGKARMYGRVIGSTLTQGSPNWSEATEFIRDIESLTDDDIAVVRILWEDQQKIYLQPDGSIDTNVQPHIVTNGWADVLDAAEKVGMSEDDFESRCSRLTGFGLAVLITNVAVSDRMTRNAFKLTGRAVRLLRLVGYHQPAV